jgi:hypothetical protein
VSVAPYNPRNTYGPFDIEYRIEDRTTEHSEETLLKQLTSDETYNCRSQVERTNEVCKDCCFRALCARAQVFLALCLRLVVAITNHERGDDSGSTVITV